MGRMETTKGDSMKKREKVEAILAGVHSRAAGSVAVGLALVAGGLAIIIAAVVGL